MNVADKRQLLVDIDMLVKRPAQATEVEINRTLCNFQLLLSDLFQMPSLKLKVMFSDEDYLANVEKQKEQAE